MKVNKINNKTARTIVRNELKRAKNSQDKTSIRILTYYYKKYY